MTSRFFPIALKTFNATKLIVKKASLSLLLLGIANSSQGHDKPPINRAMVVNCSISNQGFDEIDFEYKIFEKIYLIDISTRTGGNHLIKSTPIYDFWVSTYAAILDPKPIKVTDFKIEIRDKKTKIAYQAINHQTGDGLSASVSAVKYSKQNPQWPIAELSFECREDMSQ